MNGDLYSPGQLCEDLQLMPGELSKLARKAGVKPVTREVYDDRDVRRLRAAIPDPATTMDALCGALEKAEA